MFFGGKYGERQERGKQAEKVKRVENGTAMAKGETRRRREMGTLVPGTHRGIPRKPSVRRRYASGPAVRTDILWGGGGVGRHSLCDGAT